MTSDARPDFFIVGGPKCGTTSLYTYLAAHPEIFMSPVKEPYHFCPDLRIGLPRTADRAEYLSLFRGASGARRVGEASVWYLYSKQAARLIREFNPAARIIVMLRSPADMVFSLYHHYRYSGLEPLDRFEDALAAEAERKQGARLPARRDARETLYYREVASYPGQLQRYFEAFGRERVHVLLFDDLRDRTESTFRGVLEFLDVDSGFRADFAIANAGRQVRSAALHRALSTPLPRLFRPVTRRFPWLAGMRRRMKRGNTQTGRDVEMAPSTRRALEQSFSGEVEALERLLGRDLDRWRTPAGVHP